jgi:hypothetical protein
MGADEVVRYGGRIGAGGIRSLTAWLRAARPTSEKTLAATNETALSSWYSLPPPERKAYSAESVALKSSGRMVSAICLYAPRHLGVRLVFSVRGALSGPRRLDAL